LLELLDPVEHRQNMLFLNFCSFHQRHIVVLKNLQFA
jgi:hypothetical protein